MPNNKNQHFVPRCYLRPFSENDKGKTIRLLNIDSGRVVNYAPVKNQCSRDYFYGKDFRHESKIQKIESEYAVVLNDICSVDGIPTDRQISMLRRFWLFQNIRTEATIKRASESIAQTDLAAGREPTPATERSRETVELAMYTFERAKQSADDLRGCIVRNLTSIPFITSDNPAVLTNRWYITSPKTKGITFGQMSAGNILLLPLTSKLLFIGFDADIYSVKHTNGVIDVSAKSDVDAFNEHQLLSCMFNVYFKRDTDMGYVQELYSGVMPYRPERRHAISEVISIDPMKEKEDYGPIGLTGNINRGGKMIRAVGIHPIPKQWPSILKRKPKGIAYYGGKGVGYVRYGTRNVYLGPNPPKIKRVYV